MKNINFQRGKTGLRVWEQDQRSKVPFNWDRFIYIIILIVALFFFLRYLYNSIFYIDADGQVLFEKVNIMNTDDCRILEFHVKEGQDVKIGDSLFTFFNDEDAFGNYVSGQGGNAVSVALPGQDNDWLEREIYNLSKSISAAEVRLNESKEMLALNQSKVEQVRNEVILDVLPKSHLNDLENNIEGLKFDIQKLENELSISRAYLGKLYAMKKPVNKGMELNVSSSGNGAGGGDDTGKKVFYSPLDGTITKINFQPFEVAMRSEIILSIHKAENIFIKGYFEQGDMDKLHEGDLVHLEFPDGTKSEGVIRRFYFATNTLPEEFQKKYEPTTRTLVADIYPLDENELGKWKAFYKMSVQISKPKY